MKKISLFLLLTILFGCQKSWIDYSCQNISENEQKKSFSTDGKLGIMESSNYEKCQKKGNVITFTGKGDNCQNPVQTIDFDDVSGSLTYYYHSFRGEILVKKYQCEKVGR